MPRPHAPSRWVRWTLATLAALIPCVLFGVTTATANLGLGPHEARYEVTWDGEAIVDFGPLGTLEIDSPAPLGLGVRVTVGQIPADLTAIGQAQTLQALSGDLSSYLQFFATPEVTVQHVARALIVDAIRRTLLAMATLAVVAGALYLLLGPDRRRDLAGRLAPRTAQISAGVVTLSLLALCVTSSSAGGIPREDEPASPVFAGTALQGARITGRLAGIIDTYGKQLIDLYDESSAFYERADVNLVKAWDERLAAQDEETAATRVSPTAVATANPAATGSTPSGAPAASGAAPSSSTSAAPEPPASDIASLLVVSDLHCNMGMTALIRTAAEKSGAQVILNAGDTTMNGTALESICVDSFASAIPNGATMVVADGNHDSRETSAQERKKNERVLTGKVISVSGIRILGDADARQTRVGQGSKDTNTTPAEQSVRLTETACAAGGVDLLLIHTPSVGAEALESGCVTMQVSGHTHVRQDPKTVGGGIRYVNGSTAGALSGQPTVGPLNGTAEMTVLRFDRTSGTFLDWQLVTVDPSGAAQVGPRQLLPVVSAGSGTGAAPGPLSGTAAPPTTGAPSATVTSSAASTAGPASGR